MTEHRLPVVHATATPKDVQHAAALFAVAKRALLAESLPAELDWIEAVVSAAAEARATENAERREDAQSGANVEASRATTRALERMREREPWQGDDEDDAG